MKNRFLVCGLLMGLFACNNVFANSNTAMPYYSTAPLELNTQILDIMNNTHNEVYYQNKSNSRQNYKTPAKNKPVSQINYIQKVQPAVKNLSDRDLQIEGRIEKTQKDSLYQNQSPLELQEMVERIGKKIASANGITNSLNFKYDEQDVANANTNIKNTIRVYKGLIKYCEDEDELAYVIGHEMGHATSYHVAKGIAAKVGVGAATTAATIATEAKTHNSWAAWGVGAATEVITGLGEKKASRVMEKNADLLSIDYIVKAGYNPLASIAIMNKIGDNYVDFWTDHPSTDKRIIMMYDYIKEKYPQYLVKGFDSKYYDKAMEDYIYNVNFYNKNSKNKK